MARHRNEIAGLEYGFAPAVNFDMVIGYGFSRFRAIVKASDRANRSPRFRHFRRRAESDRGVPIVLKPRRRRRRQRMMRDGGASTTVLLLGLILAVALWWLKFGAKALG